MNNNQRIQEWFIICAIAALCLTGIAGAVSCANDDFEKRKQWADQNPVEHAKDQCWSKIRGARPACWREGDWIEFCKRVECKQR